MQCILGSCGLVAPNAQSTILFDTRDLSLAEGTGIATYTRELLNAARTLGFATDALVATKSYIGRNDPLLSAIQADDIAPSFTVGDYLGRALSWAVGRPLGMSARQIDTALPNANCAFDGFSQFNRVFGAPHVFEVAHSHFSKYGKRLPVNLPNPPVIFHATSPMPLRVRGSANVYTIHDLVPILFPFMTTDNKRHLLSVLREIVRTADHIVTVSEHSRADVIRLLGVEEDRITNTYQCIADDTGWLESPDASASVIECLESHELEFQKYFIFVGTIEPKKNISKLVDAYSKAKCRFPLLIVGADGWLFEEDNRKMTDERFLRYHLIDGVFAPRRQVRRLPYLPRTEMLQLVRGARALLFPSLYEGFGLPVLEAMQLGVPVLTSNLASLKEIAGDAALLVDPTNSADIAKGIQQLETDTELCKALVEKGLARALLFSPAKYQERIGSVYKALS